MLKTTQTVLIPSGTQETLCFEVISEQKDYSINKVWYSIRISCLKIIGDKPTLVKLDEKTIGYDLSDWMQLFGGIKPTVFESTKDFTIVEKLDYLGLKSGDLEKYQ